MSGKYGEACRSRTRILVAAALIGTFIGSGAGALAAEAEKKSEDRKAEMSREEREQKLEAARKRLDAAAQEVAELSMSMSEDAWPIMRKFATMGGANRAMLGVNIGSAGSNAPDDGVEVASVSPGGSAADAGLKSGDVLTEANGKSLKREGDQSPREKLMAVMRQVKPGEKVALTYRRDGKVARTTIVARPLTDRFFTMAMPPMHGTVGVNRFGTVGPMANFAFMRADGVFGSAELVPLTPKLGQYFGTEKGLLVVRAPVDSRLKLEDGDVIVDIDGRTPSSPVHALRILGSYQPGEKLKLNVLRSRKKMAFDITVPEDTWERPVGGAGFHFKRDDVMLRGAPGMPIPATPMMAPLPAPNTVPLPPPPPLPDEEEA